jgi:hypothetical protein
MNPPSKRSTFVSFLILVLLSGGVVMDIGAVVGTVLGTVGGVGGGAVGLAIAAFLIAKRDTFRLRPIIWFGIALGSIALYFLLRSVLFQLDSVTLPSYLPSEWIALTCTIGLGLLIGAGLPLLVYALVVEGYQLLE